MHFELYLFAILPFDSALGEGGTQGYEKYSVNFGHFRLKLGFFFFHSGLELGKFLRGSYFFHH